MGLVIGKMPASSESREDFSLGKRLVRLSNKGDFVDGYAVMDSTLVEGTKGVGKTSAVVASLGRSILEWRGSLGGGSGGLVVTGTTEAKDDFLTVATAASRLDDVIIVRAGEHRFNFLSYIAGWGGDETFYV